MAQHDYNIHDQPGASFLADLNNALAAVATQNSGATQPSPTFPYQLWADTTAGVLKMRNAANTAWITVMTLANAKVLAASTADSASTATSATTAASAQTLTGTSVSNIQTAALGTGTASAATYLRGDRTWAAIPTPVVSDIVGLVMLGTGGGGSPLKAQRVDGNFVPILRTDSTWFNWHPIYAGIGTQIIDGQYMVRIPQFWIKAGVVPSGDYAGNTYWMISPYPVSGFSVHPAFVGAGGAELDQIWVGKYQASASGGKLQSVAGVLPRVSMDFTTARSEAYARNTGGVTGFRLWSIYDLSAIQMLAAIEMGGLDMQSLIGQGRVYESSAANVDAPDVAQATWRGIVGLWGNVWQMVDGIKTRDGSWHRWQYNVPGSTTTSDYSTGYVNTSQAVVNGGSYLVTFNTSLLGVGILAAATVTGTASNGSTGDYWYSYSDSSDRIWYHGGDGGNGALAGLFCALVDYTPAYTNSAVGARLAKV